MSPSLGYEKSDTGSRCLGWSLEVAPASLNACASGSGVSLRAAPPAAFERPVHKSVHEAWLVTPGWALPGSA